MRIPSCDSNLIIINKLTLIDLQTQVGITYSNHISIKYENVITFTIIFSNNGTPQKLTKNR